MWPRQLCGGLRQLLPHLDRTESVCLQEDFTKAMQGIVCDTDVRVRDEAPQAYKDLAKVMANQASLTEVVHRYVM